MAYTILEQVKIRLGQFHIDETGDAETVVFDQKEKNPLLNQLIDQAKQEIISKRGYPESYTDERIADDLKRFESVIVNLVVYDSSQAGESYMATYTENGVSRNWIERDSLLNGVFPFVKIL